MSKKLKKSSVMTDPLPESEVLKNIDQEIESIEYIEKAIIQKNQVICNTFFYCAVAVFVIGAISFIFLRNNEAKLVSAFLGFLILGTLYFFYKIYAERNWRNKIRKRFFRAFIVVSSILAMVALISG